MARCGRKPQAEAAVERLAGSDYAKERLVAILKTMRQEWTVFEALEELGIGESRFHAMRNQWLQEALQLLEPRPMGRPPSDRSAATGVELKELRQRVAELERELAACRVRMELGQTMPHVLKSPSASEKRGRRAKRRKTRPR